jgi:hypothetical protein
MAKKAARVWQLGDYVHIKYSGFKRARIVELRGALGPGGSDIYRVRIIGTASPKYIEVGEDQLEPVAEEGG